MRDEEMRTVVTVEEVRTYNIGVLIRVTTKYMTITSGEPKEVTGTK